jgi:hypothetical protein
MKKDEIGIVILKAMLVLFVVQYVIGCSVKIETQWFGQSEIDHKNTSPKKP